MNNSRIVIADIHGCANTFKALLDKLPEGIPVTVSGDYVDRGPRSNEVIQLMIDRNIEGTLGNHEQMMLDFFEEHSDLLTKVGTYEMRSWNVFLGNGGDCTLESYGYSFPVSMSRNYTLIDIPEDKTQLISHLEWIKNLPVYREYSECVNDEGRKLIVSHSSINDYYSKKDDPNMKTNIIWNRHVTKGGIKDIKEIYSVFGHTVEKNGPRIKTPFANLDTGCCFIEEGYGFLTALQYPEMMVYQQENIDYDNT